MYTVDLYLRVRLACHVDGLSQREAASRFGIARETVRKMLRHSEPPGYRRRQPPKRPKLAPFTDIIDRILEEDRPVHRKQHHTAKRIFDRLRAEHGFSGGYTIVKDYVREHHRRRREMFVPLIHPPGHGQADFGEARAVIGGVARKAHFFVFDLPHSDACYVRAYPAAGGPGGRGPLEFCMAPLPAPAEKPSQRVSESQSHAKLSPPAQVAVFCAALWPNLQPALTVDRTTSSPSPCHGRKRAAAKPINYDILKETDDAASDPLHWAPTIPSPGDVPVASPQLSRETV